MRINLPIMAFAIAISQAIPASADGIESSFTTAEIHIAGQEAPLTAVLYTSSEPASVMISRLDRNVTLGGQTLSMDNIDYISFGDTVMVVDGIGQTIADTPAKADDNVYRIDGTLAKRNAQNLDGLPKGVYIYHRQKHIVK